VEAALPAQAARARVRAPAAALFAAWTLALAGAIALRSTGVPFWETIWAEDGTVFVQDALDRSILGALFTPYAGYLHVPARLLGELTVLFPAEWWAVVLAAFSITVAAGAGAYVYCASRDVLTTRWARLVAAALPWLAATGEEVPANVANLHWYGLYAAFWALMARPQTRRGLAAAATVVTLTALSDPMVALALPLALLQVRALGRRGLLVLVPLLVALAAQAFVTLTGHGPEAVTAFHADEAVGIYGQRVAGAAFLGDENFLALWDLAGWAAIWGALAVAAGAVAVAARHHPRLALSAVAGSVALLAVPLVLRGTTEIAPDAGSLGASRYMLVPVALLLVAFLAGLDRGGSRRARQAFTLLLVVVAVSGLGAATSRGEGPSWSGTLQRACADDAPAASVLIAPAGLEEWHIRLDCRRG
jgi:hypothetical protein